MTDRPHDLREVCHYGGIPVFVCQRCGAYRVVPSGWEEDCPKFEPPEPDPPGFGESPSSVGQALDRALGESEFDRLDRKYRR